MARRHIRLEEYASSGLAEDVDDSISHVKIRPMRSSTKDTSTSNVARVAHSASASHRQNDRYMEAFDVAFEELSAAEAARTGVSRERHEPREKSPSGSSAGKTKQLLATTASGNGHKTAVGDLSGAWLQGPSVPEGELHAVSAQPLMCMSMSADESEVVVGSSDHALYVISLGSSSSGRTSRAASSRPRTLYTKRFGHTEWVTCVTHLPDRRIFSGGMDSKLCLWDATGVKCEDLLGHSGSVSCVLAMSDEMVLSAGYDKMLRLWNVSRRASSSQRELSVIKAGTAPILDVALLCGAQQVAVCGDRDGGVQLIDLEANKVLRKVANAHRGHTTSVLGSQGDEDRCFVSGGQDGFVKVWDSRRKDPAFSLGLHLDPRSGKAGAVGFLHQPAEDPNILITGGADGVLNVLDRRQSYSVVHSFAEHLDFIYSLHVRNQLCFSGAGNGMLHVHDWKKGKLLYGLGANQAAVRAVAASTKQLVAAGDDGGVVVYDML